MEKQYMDIPNGAPPMRVLRCPWCGAQLKIHARVQTVFCSDCGRTLEHSNAGIRTPLINELKACSEAQLDWMFYKYCVPSGDIELARRITQILKDRKDIAFETAKMMCGSLIYEHDGWVMLEKLAEENDYDALAMLYNQYFTEDFRYQSQLEKYSELLVRHHGDLTAADTLRTILKKDGRQY